MLLLFSIFLYKLTEGYSGSDIRLVCKEAAMRPVRKIFDILELHEAGLSFIYLFVCLFVCLFVYEILIIFFSDFISQIE